MGGGAERVVSWLANGLVRRGHEVSLIIRTPPETDFYDVDPDVQVARHLPPRLNPVAHLKAGSAKRVALTFINRYHVVKDQVAFAVAVRSSGQEADVVVSFIDRMNVHVLLGMLGSRTPVVVSERVDPVFHQLGRLVALRPLLYRRSAATVVQSHEIQARVERDWRLTNVATIPNTSAVTPSPEVAASVGRQRVVLCAGRLHQQKDHATLVRAWAKTDAATQGWKLRILGEGPERVHLEDLTRELGVVGSVELPGVCTDMAEQYLSAAIFVLPSLYEGFPNVLLEAMNCGCACIAADCPGASGEILGDGRFGILVRPGDAVALAEQIDALVGDPEAVSALGRAARERAGDFNELLVYGLWERVLRQSVVDSR
jgi:glycosyltransferase involved in cell wall biosynthesis